VVGIVSHVLLASLHSFRQGVSIGFTGAVGNRVFHGIFRLGIDFLLADFFSKKSLKKEHIVSVHS
jgi:hypothetical protein